MIGRQICERAVFDGGFDDPRVLTYYYQQRLRTKLLAQATQGSTPATRRILAASPFTTLVRAIKSAAQPLLDQPSTAPRLRAVGQAAG